MNNGVISGIAAGLFLLGAVASANASTIVGATGVTSNMGVLDPTSPLENMINHSFGNTGGSDYVSGSTDYDAYTSSQIHSWGPTREWWGTEATGYVEFDLGSAYMLDGFAVWNEDLNGINEFDVWTSTSSDPASFVLQGTFFAANTPDPNPVPNSYGAETFDFTTSTLAQYVRFDIKSIYIAATSTESGASIGEVAFEQTAPVPEPATLVLLGAGLAGIAGIRRKNA